MPQELVSEHHIHPTHLVSLDRLSELLHEGGAHGWVDEDPWRFPCLAFSKVFVDANEQLQPSVHAGGRVEVKPTPAEDQITQAQFSP